MSAFLNLPNLISLTGLLCGLAAALLGVSGEVHLGLVALVASGICDLFDGFVARRLDLPPEAREFGRRLDSVVDVCSFGFAPAVLLHGYGLRAPHEAAALGALLVAAAWRLAWFDTFGLAAGEAGAKYYRGLPVTYVALVVPVTFLADVLRPGVLRPFLFVEPLALAALMVSPLRIRKPGGVFYAVFLALAVVVSAVLIAARLRAGPSAGAPAGP